MRKNILQHKKDNFCVILSHLLSQVTHVSILVQIGSDRVRSSGEEKEVKTLRKTIRDVGGEGCVFKYVLSLNAFFYLSKVYAYFMISA